MLNSFIYVLSRNFVKLNSGSGFQTNNVDWTSDYVAAVIKHAYR